MLEVHGGLLAWTVVTFLILLVILKKVAWGPILSVLESREAEIRDALNSAAKAREDAEKASRDYEELVKKAGLRLSRLLPMAKLLANESKMTSKLQPAGRPMRLSKKRKPRLMLSGRKRFRR